MIADGIRRIMIAEAIISIVNTTVGMGITGAGMAAGAHTDTGVIVQASRTCGVTTTKTQTKMWGPTMPLILDLSPELQAERRTGIGASHAPKLMSGNWQEVWLEITGRVQPRKIMSDWNYALRMATETLQLDWHEHKTGERVTRRGESARSSIYSFMRCTLDGMIEGTGEPINAKHVSSWTKEARAWTVDKYLWQILHEVVVLMPPTMRGYISLLVGEKEPEIIPIDADPVSLDRLIHTEEEFWFDYVLTDRPPDAQYSSIAPIVEWEKMRTVDMAHSNAWAEHASVWRETIGASRRCDQAAKELRALVDADVAEARGHGVVIKRSKDGKIMLKEAGDA